jgi:hypothetical protein
MAALDSDRKTTSALIDIFGDLVDADVETSKRGGDQRLGR